MKEQKENNNKIKNVFKNKHPIIIDDRSSYYDSDREKVFYNEFKEL